MKTSLRIIQSLILILAISALASLCVMALWNGIVTAVCGFPSVSYLQAVGLFALGLLLSGGFLGVLFITLGWAHHTFHGSRNDRPRHWHTMTPEQRKEFIRRRHEFFARHQFSEENAND